MSAHPPLDHPHVWVTRLDGSRACLTCTATAPPRPEPGRGEQCVHAWTPVPNGLRFCALCAELGEAPPDP